MNQYILALFGVGNHSDRNVSNLVVNILGTIVHDGTDQVLEMFWVPLHVFVVHHPNYYVYLVSQQLLQVRGCFNA